MPKWRPRTGPSTLVSRSTSLPIRRAATRRRPMRAYVTTGAVGPRFTYSATGACTPTSSRSRARRAVRRYSSASSISGTAAASVRDGGERRQHVGDHVVRVLEPARQADRTEPDVGGLALLGREVHVRGRGGV